LFAVSRFFDEAPSFHNFSTLQDEVHDVVVFDLVLALQPLEKWIK
jgi:hypothetical protein